MMTKNEKLHKIVELRRHIATMLDVINETQGILDFDDDMGEGLDTAETALVDLRVMADDAERTISECD